MFKNSLKYLLLFLFLILGVPAKSNQNSALLHTIEMEESNIEFEITKFVLEIGQDLIF